MEVILTQDVTNIGKAGERIRVRDGFSRNYLIPNKLAVPITEGGLRFLEARKKRAEEARAQEKVKAEQLSEQLNQLACVLKVKVGQEGKLFGSVTRQDIQTALKKEGFEIDKRHIETEPLHQVGEYRIKIKLHSEVEAQLKVIITQA